MTVEDLNSLLAEPEGERLEFKEARNNYSWKELVKYGVALTNERGGYLILGVTNKRPRKIVGSRAFENLGNCKKRLTETLKLRVEAEEIEHPSGRVVVFRFPSRPIGHAIQHDGSYWMRSDDAVVAMTPDYLRSIFAEGSPDFTAQICAGASTSDLSMDAVQLFRQDWHRKSGNARILSLTQSQLFRDCDLVNDGGLTYAALILLGSEPTLRKYLRQSEIVYEYRSADAKTAPDIRVNLRDSGLLMLEHLWQLVDQHNTTETIQDGLFVRQVPRFNERSIREAILNAVCHREYKLQEAVFVLQTPDRLEVVSPGGFPAGISVSNILDKQYRRNRLLAEALERCGRIERSGQGVDLMFETAIKEGKPRPDFTGTSDYEVRLTLRGAVRDPRFLMLLESVGMESLRSFTIQDLITFEDVYRGTSSESLHRESIRKLLDAGLIEAAGGRGKHRTFAVARKYSQHLNDPASRTRRLGLDRRTQKALLLRHIRDNGRIGCQLDELKLVLPHLTQYQVQRLLRDLKKEGEIRVEGRTRGARWYPSNRGSIRHK